MDQDDNVFLRDLFRAVADRALEPGDQCYVPLYDDDRLAVDDPVELLARGIGWTPGQSVQLLSGFRGTGKSTELRRLRKRLREAGYLVVLCDIEDYVNLSTPVDVSDFLMAVTGAFGEALQEPELLGKDIAREGYWERLEAFLIKTRINLDDLKLKPEVAGASVLEIKASLKSDPTFKQRLQERLAGHLGSLVRDVREYLKDAVGSLKKRHGDATEVVLLVDSMEHIRGTSANADEVHRSVETLFAGHADKLHLPNLHVVYTVPPYLKVRYPNVDGLYAPGGLQILPAVKLRADSGEKNRAGFDALATIVQSRGDWERLLGNREALDALIEKSGGHLRDLLRLLAEVIRRASSLPVERRTVEAAISQVRNGFLPIAEQDALWLQRVAETHSAALEESDRLPDLARFLDTHMILCYRNGHEWYDVHPLIAEVVKDQAVARLQRPASAAEEPAAAPE
ncbi:MAG: hypothetical protein GY856_44045 [bacterium]|nr:hypothetical protein [bacterium]